MTTLGIVLATVAIIVLVAYLIYVDNDIRKQRMSHYFHTSVHMSEDLKNLYKHAESTESKEKYLSCIQCSIGCSMSCRDSCFNQSNINELNYHSNI